MSSTPLTRKKGARPRPTAPIRADESYSVDEFLRRVGWKRAALTAARKMGLRVVLAGGRSYVIGDDWLAYLRAVANEK